MVEEEGELQKRILANMVPLPCGRSYRIDATRYKAGLIITELETINFAIYEAKQEFLNILQKQHDQNSYDANERLKWFIKYFGSSQKMEIDTDGFVKWFGEVEKENRE